MTTKHDYDISYKYAWECLNGQCGLVYERHSRSIDVKKQGCGKCKGRLVQVRPVPRSGLGVGDAGAGRSEYQVFVKDNYERLKREIEEQKKGNGEVMVGMTEVMALLGKEFRAMKAARGAITTTKSEAIVVDDEISVGDPVDGLEIGEVDNVARKLGVLSVADG